MTPVFLGDPLIEELLTDPEGFYAQGRAYDLLKRYFAGYPIHTLRPLLSHDNEFVVRAAIWIVSELGERGCALLDDIIPLLESGSRYIKYYALDVAIVCSIGTSVERFVHVLKTLQSEDEVLRVHAMWLISRADRTQLQAAVQLLNNADSVDEAHLAGMQQLLRRDLRGADEISDMLLSSHHLVRRYGAIAAKRAFGHFPELIQQAANASDPDIARFAREALTDAGDQRRTEKLDF